MAIASLAACGLGLSGCSEADPIRSYRVPKPQAVYQSNHVPRPTDSTTSAAAVAPRQPAAPREETTFQYDTPAGWTAGQQLVSRGGITLRYRAALQVVDGDQKVEITVSDFPQMPKFLLANVNRWREQLGLEQVTQQQLDQQLQQLRIGEIPGHYVEMAGTDPAGRPTTILAAIAEHGESSWFFKLIGDTELAEREKERFQSFAKSARFGN